MRDCITAAYGEGKYRIEAAALRCGSDVSVTFTGGERAHIGAVSLAVYEPERDSATVSTVTAYGHRDDELSRAAAKKLAAAWKCTVSVSVGIHVDAADRREIQLLSENFSSCQNALIEAMAGMCDS